MAYVGGGFGRAGLHSVLEPAAWGVPVAFGPNWRNSRDAGLLLRGGAAEALGRGPGNRRDGVALSETWERWIADESHRMTQGGRARAIVSEGLGAARRSAEMLAAVISSRSPRP
jgi:3-deoxy-D-manno-octulosonic-acid transferase